MVLGVLVVMAGLPAAGKSAVADGVRLALGHLAEFSEAARDRRS